MSRCSQLVLCLFFAACEQASPSHRPPVFPEPAPTAAPAPAPDPAPAPAPVVEAAKPETQSAVAPVEPRPTRAAPTRAVPKSPASLIEERRPPGKGHWSPPGCRPGSRLVCRWEPETDERQLPRVKKAGTRTDDRARDTRSLPGALRRRPSAHGTTADATAPEPRVRDRGPGDRAARVGDADRGRVPLGRRVRGAASLAVGSRGAVRRAVHGASPDRRRAAAHPDDGRGRRVARWSARISRSISPTWACRPARSGRPRRCEH